MKKFTMAALIAVLLTLAAFSASPAASAASDSLDGVSPDMFSFDVISAEPHSVDSALPDGNLSEYDWSSTAETVTSESPAISRPDGGTAAETGDAGFAVFALLTAVSGAAIAVLTKKQPS